MAFYLKGTEEIYTHGKSHDQVGEVSRWKKVARDVSKKR